MLCRLHHLSNKSQPHILYRFHASMLYNYLLQLCIICILLMDSKISLLGKYNILYRSYLQQHQHQLLLAFLSHSKFHHRYILYILSQSIPHNENPIKLLNKLRIHILFNHFLTFSLYF